ERAAAAREELAAALPARPPAPRSSGEAPGRGAAAGPRIELFPRRLEGAADAAALAAAVRERFGTDPAVLVHCAGGIADRLFLDSRMEDHLRLLGEHLVAGMALAHALVPAMAKARWGRLVFLSSIGARWAKRGQTGYAAAKAGLEGFTRALALEVAHRGVTVNAVAPGLVETSLTAPLLAAWRAAGERLRHRIPAGRPGRPEEVAALVAFLCSEEAAYLTGAVLPIDGGRSLGDPTS
ncbi:MAG TPA: SDR family oxidoreductase, partial [Thermoanaerobaculia bacterium]|nr:SDR family oxidoreductase [Thermoanaerobaculia bacterium]